MYLVYVDESGDPGVVRSPTRYFVLAALVVHETRWRLAMERLRAFRVAARERYGLRLRDELHAARMINNPGPLVRIARADRLAVLREFADTLARIPDLTLLHVVIDKQARTDDVPVFDAAWSALLRRIENGIATRRFRGPANPDDHAVLLPDATDGARLERLMDEHREFSTVTPGGRPLLRLVEQPLLRNSIDSLLIQAADLCAFLVYQALAPSAYGRRKSLQNYVYRLGELFDEARKSEPRVEEEGRNE